MLQSEDLHNPEHRTWNSEHVRWLDELQTWRRENCEARDSLRELEQALVSQQNTFEDHRLVMVALEQEFHRLEHVHAGSAELAAVRHRQFAESLHHRHLGFRHQAIMAAVAQLKVLLTPA